MGDGVAVATYDVEESAQHVFAGWCFGVHVAGEGVFEVCEVALVGGERHGATPVPGWRKGQAVVGRFGAAWEECFCAFAELFVSAFAVEEYEAQFGAGSSRFDGTESAFDHGELVEGEAIAACFFCGEALFLS